MFWWNILLGFTSDVLLQQLSDLNCYGFSVKLFLLGLIEFKWLDFFCWFNFGFDGIELFPRLLVAHLSWGNDVGVLSLFPVPWPAVFCNLDLLVMAALATRGSFGCTTPFS
ncbi:hypothetical protein KFK09_027540 [Dendrobium nobile]|uniref:Uncharacterized protein n=1 Tax=Dendrobium nobile TaxID=94219 RepID=A0A8T3AB35_DENNO|nr:hypothetical protein KFK09_027540 [Dendrobium nobile]